MFAIPPGNTSLKEFIENVVAAIYGQDAIAEFDVYSGSGADSIIRSEPVPLTEQECVACSLPHGTVLAKEFVSRAGVEIRRSEDGARRSDARRQVEIAFEDGGFELFFKADDGAETSLRSLPVMDDYEFMVLFHDGRIGDADVYISNADANKFVEKMNRVPDGSDQPSQRLGGSKPSTLERNRRAYDEVKEQMRLLKCTLKNACEKVAGYYPDEWPSGDAVKKARYRHIKTTNAEGQKGDIAE